MAVSESRKRANRKWDSKNLTVVGCKMRRDAADEFKVVCKAVGTTPNAVFRAAVDDFMAQHQDTAQPTPDGTESI